MNATYFCNGIEYPATIRLDKKRIAIAARSEQGTNDVYWQYEKIKATERARHFTYDDYPPQTLEVLQPALATGLAAAIQQHRGKARGRGMLMALRLLIAVILFFVVLYVALVPWLAGALANRFPASYERQLGDQLYASLEKNLEVDRPATESINRFYQALAIPSRHPIRITVVKDDVANAFALPGGHIVVYHKLLRGIGSYEELAALLSHEMVHIEARHTVRTLFRQMGSALFLSLLIGDAGAISAIVLNNANELKNLSYSRSLEAEADAAGARLLAQRGISCNGFVNLFQLLEKQSSGPQPSEWLSSHPDLKKRIRQVQQNKACANNNPVRNEELHGLFLSLKTAE